MCIYVHICEYKYLYISIYIAILIIYNIIYYVIYLNKPGFVKYIILVKRLVVHLLEFTINIYLFFQNKIIFSTRLCLISCI